MMGTVSSSITRMGRYMADNKILCPTCKIELTPGTTIVHIYYGSPVFSGSKRVTMPPGGAGEVVNCLRCGRCGYVLM